MSEEKKTLQEHSREFQEKVSQDVENAVTDGRRLAGLPTGGPIQPSKEEIERQQKEYENKMAEQARLIEEGRRKNFELAELDDSDSLPVYLQRSDCSEEQVNALIQLGYTPWQITPMQKIIHRANGTMISSETSLIYHFIRKKA